jgi:inner membrane protein
MFIGHLPAGYILTKNLQKRMRIQKYLWIGLVGSVFSDIDLFYFYLIDGRQTAHHQYWTHIPFYWILITGIAVTLFYSLKKIDYAKAALIFCANVFLHLFLDTIVGGIYWLYPFSVASFKFFDVPNRYDFWVFNFIFHWSFLFEILVIVWALIVMMKSRRVKQRRS